MTTQRIKIEKVTLRGHDKEGNKVTGTDCFLTTQVACFRIFSEDYQEVERVAARMLTSYLHANPGTLATYVISGCSFRDEGASW